MAKRSNGESYISEKQGRASDAYQARRLQQATNRVARGEDREQRSPQQQLDVLDRRLGKNIGATKERLKLEAFIKNAAVVKE